LREAIDRTHLPDWKKKRLHQRLDDLEKEFARGRVRFVVVAGIVMAILAAPGELAGSYDAVVRITNNIMRELGEAKAQDDEQRKVSHDEPVALLPPRKLEAQKTRGKKDSWDELDDEIPF
jgi:hypothetical protein